MLDYFPSLTGIRAVASIMVYLAHFNPFTGSFFGKYIPAYVSQFHVGVTMFFVLSGFLICYRYEPGFQQRGLTGRNYFVSRVAKIYPMYFLLTVWAFLPVVSKQVFRPGGFLLNISFLRGFSHEYLFTGDPSGWSLSVEELFYVLFPLMVLYSRRIPYLLQAALFLLTGYLLTLVFSHVSFHGFFSSYQFLFEYTFFGRCFEFYTGILLARYIRARAAERDANGAGALRPSAIPWRTMAGTGWVALGIGFMAINYYVNVKIRPGRFLAFETLLNNFLLPPGIALLFYGLIAERSWWQRLLASRLLGILGKSSYVFYLIHVPLFGLFYFGWFGQKPLPTFICIEVLAWLLYIGIEHPLNGLIRRKFLKVSRKNSIEVAGPQV
ncbi:MAG TPA: acyltransferase [Puia sp.]|nr:acyltransferase [Puia sp.]